MMARREWGDLSQEQRAQLQREGISQSDWESGSSPVGSPNDPPGDPPGDPPANASTSGEFPDPGELEEAVNDPDAHSDFWWARGGGRLSARARDELEDRALRNREREVGESEKYSRNAVAERMERMTANQLKIVAAMDEGQMRRMARWANEVLQRTGSKSFMWLFYH